MRIRHLVMASAIALSIVSLDMPSSAQVVVFDPNNYAKNVLTAARALQQINNQITSLQNQAQMLINQARNLASLPYSSLRQLQSSIQRTQQLLAPGVMVLSEVARRLMMMSGSGASTCTAGYGRAATSRLTEVITTTVPAGHRQPGGGGVNEHYPAFPFSPAASMPATAQISSLSEVSPLTPTAPSRVVPS
jgi:4-diphosphocytidyl-2C-methyl-D-erythritol kinase